jgi:hypothetical protein
VLHHVSVQHVTKFDRLPIADGPDAVLDGVSAMKKRLDTAAEIPRQALTASEHFIVLTLAVHGAASTRQLRDRTGMGADDVDQVIDFLLGYGEDLQPALIDGIGLTWIWR